MRGDGDGWVETPIGPMWGRYSAAGLLLYSVNNVGETVILLQHRATWVAQGDTWALPGGPARGLGGGGHPAGRGARR